MHARKAGALVGVKSTPPPGDSNKQPGWKLYFLTQCFSNCNMYQHPLEGSLQENSAVMEGRCPPLPATCACRVPAL